MVEVWRVLFAIVCVCFSAMFAGLTLGMLTLDLFDLRIIAESGTVREREQARRVMSVRKHGNYLLCTLLTGNTAANALFSILTAELTSGLIGFVISTLAILFFAEIIPQSICHRFGLRIGAAMVWLVKIFMIVLTPISFPTSRILDYFLGTEPITRYNKRALKALLSIQTRDNAIAAAAETVQAERQRKALKTRRRRRRKKRGSVQNSPVTSTGEHPRSSNETAPGHGKSLKDAMRRAFRSRSSSERASTENPTPESEAESGALRVTGTADAMSSKLDAWSTAPADALVDVERGVSPSPADARIIARPPEASVIGGRDSASIVAGAIGATYAAAASKASTEQITMEEGLILSGALEFAAKTVEQIMTPLNKVFMLSGKDRLDFKTMASIFQSGHSRIPVYLGKRSNITGVIFTKDLILIDPDDNIPVSAILLLFRRELRRVVADVHLNVLLNEFKTGRGHLAIVQRSSSDEAVGIVTLEDVIEEIIQSEIVDETDVYRDNVRDEVVVRKRRIDADLLRMLDSTPRYETHLTAGEVSIIASFLANNFAREFGESKMSFHQLEHLLANCTIAEYDRPGAPINGLAEDEPSHRDAISDTAGASDDDASVRKAPEVTVWDLDGTRSAGSSPAWMASRGLDFAAATGRSSGRSFGSKEEHHTLAARRSIPLSAASADDLTERSADFYIYKRGVPSHHATLILSGHVEIMWDRRRRISETGPWTLLAREALEDELYVADFTARGVEFPLRLLRIPTRLYRRSIRLSAEEAASPQAGVKSSAS
jgi:CBS domain containing-hemolysin-like protein